MIEVVVADTSWARVLPKARSLARQAARAASSTSDLTIVLSNDAEVRRLNARFRGKDAPTNVLAFPAARNAEGHIGDVVLALETCARESAEQRKSLGDHLRHLVVHGVLHLIGYDHLSEDEAERMEAMETHLLEGLGVGDPYASGMAAE